MDSPIRLTGTTAQLAERPGWLQTPSNPILQIIYFMSADPSTRRGTPPNAQRVLLGPQGFMLLHKALRESVLQASSGDCLLGVICSYSLKKVSTHAPQQSGYCFPVITEGGRTEEIDVPSRTWQPAPA